MRHAKTVLSGNSAGKMTRKVARAAVRLIYGSPLI
jgi:hypothetical protein